MQSVDEGFLVSCSCGSTCENAETCDCQDELPRQEDENGLLAKTFAYDEHVSNIMQTNIYTMATMTDTVRRDCLNLIARWEASSLNAIA